MEKENLINGMGSGEIIEYLNYQIKYNSIYRNFLKQKLYRNLKNRHIYQVTNFSIHTETLEVMVEYYDVFSRIRYVRPLGLFIQKFQEI